MQVIQIGDDWPTERPGGLNSYFSNLIAHQAQAGIVSHGIVVGDGKVKIDSNGIVAAFARSDAPLGSRMISARRAVGDLLKRYPIDLIAVHFALYALPVSDYIRRRPTVVHFHGPWAAESGAEGANGPAAWLKGQLERSVYSAASRLIVLSKAFQGVLTRSYGIPEDRIRIVPGGVDTVRFNVDTSRSAARQHLGWPEDRKIFFCVRRHVRRMGLENLIDAAHLLSAEGHDFILYLGGTGPISGELRQRIVDRHLETRIIMLGRVADADLPLAYRAADLSIVPSQALEGFGLIAVESLAAGTPVYVTPIGGLPEIVQPFAPECIFEDTSAAAIANGLRRALRSDQTVPSEQACRSYALDHFSWPKIAAQVQSVYEEALA